MSAFDAGPAEASPVDRGAEELRAHGRIGGRVIARRRASVAEVRRGRGWQGTVPRDALRQRKDGSKHHVRGHGREQSSPVPARGARSRCASLGGRTKPTCHALGDGPRRAFPTESLVIGAQEQRRSSWSQALSKCASKRRRPVRARTTRTRGGYRRMTETARTRGITPPRSGPRHHAHVPSHSFRPLAGPRAHGTDRCGEAARHDERRQSRRGHEVARARQPRTASRDPSEDVIGGLRHQIQPAWGIEAFHAAFI
jgi:hypothetical protein